MHLHRRLVLTKLGPREEREAKIDGGGVQSIQTLVQIDIDRIARIERASGAIAIKTCAKSA